MPYEFKLLKEYLPKEIGVGISFKIIKIDDKEVTLSLVEESIQKKKEIRNKLGIKPDDKYPGFGCLKTKVSEEDIEAAKKSLFRDVEL